MRGIRRRAAPQPPIPSPNIWHWPEVYEQENAAQDADGTLWAALCELAPFAGADVLDIGCGDGYHLPRFAAEAASVTGVEPYPPLVERARRRVGETARVLCAGAADLPLPDASVDLVHARTAYFFGPGCEPGLAEAQRVLRPGGAIAIVDLDAGIGPYGEWMRADIPSYDLAAVEQFFDRSGFTLHRVPTRWAFPDRATLEAVLRIEFSAPVAARAIAATVGLSLSVGYRLHVRRSGGIALR